MLSKGGLSTPPTPDAEGIDGLVHFTHGTEDVFELDVIPISTAPWASWSGKENPASKEWPRKLLDEDECLRHFGCDDPEPADVLKVRWMRLLERDAMVETVNTVLSTAELALRFARHDAKDWHLYDLVSGGPLATRLRLEKVFA